MDVVLALRADAQINVALSAAVQAVATVPATLVHTRHEAELTLRARARDIAVVDPDVVEFAFLVDLQVDGAPRLVGWLPSRSPSRAAALLDAGADEVLDASMTDVELAARLRRVARTHAVPVTARIATFDGLSVDARRRIAEWQGRPLPLTPRETDVLQVLVAGGGLTVSRETIYRQVWRWAMPRGDRTVDVNIRRLRSKLAAADVPLEIVAEPGVGYRLRVSTAVSGL